MAGRTVLHVGTMKSGTTHVQGRLFANQDRLLDAGVLVPGSTWHDQVLGVRDLITMQREQRESTGPWQRLADQIAAHEGTAVVSMEFLGPAGPAVVRGIGRTVPGLEVVVTVRDLNRTLAAMWQETIQNGRAWSWEDYLEAVERHRPGAHRRGEPLPEAARTFWRQQDLARMVRRWSAVAPVTVVTVPPPGAPRALLWERICRVLELPEDGPGDGAPWSETLGGNESIGAASALSLWRLNQLLEARLSRRSGELVRKQVLAKELLAARKAQEPAIGLPVPDWLRDHARTMLEQVRGRGVTLVGDWDELEPVAVPGVDVGEVAGEQVLEATLAGLAGLVDRRVRAPG